MRYRLECPLYIVWQDCENDTFKEATSVGPLTESDHNSYGTDYANVPTIWALKISETLKFPAIYKHVFTRNLIGFDYSYH